MNFEKFLITKFIPNKNSVSIYLCNVFDYFRLKYFYLKNLLLRMNKNLIILNNYKLYYLYVGILKT